jgi:hypothetical protein
VFDDVPQTIFPGDDDEDDEDDDDERRRLDALPLTTLPTSNRRVPLAPNSVAHCSVQLVVGVYVMFMPASQQPSTGQAAQCVPLKYVGGTQKTQPLVPSTYWPVGQSSRQSVSDVAPASETSPAGHEVAPQSVRP